jgi:hypothetical protein
MPAIDTTLQRLQRLAAAVRLSEDLAAADREARDAEIEAAELEGFGIRDIARATGLAPSRIQAIVIRRTAARQAALRRTAGL